MMSQVAQALDATLHGSDVLMTGVSKDTRDIQTGDMYVALKGERFDGHRFAKDAVTAGAAGLLISDYQADEVLSDVAQVQVADTRLALGELAAYWCQKWRHDQVGGELIAITGSNGKTSVKEMCNKVLGDYVGQSAVLATKGNLNNDIGMPMTLLKLAKEHQYAVIEMGANHVGEINYLTMIAKPDVAILNNVGPAHLEGFGSLENIAKAKAEIFNGLNEDGVAVFNRDDNFSAYWDDCCAGIKTVSFSMLDASASVYAKALGGDEYQVTAGAEQAKLKLKVPGKHNVMNALAAIAATYSLGLSLQSTVNSLSQFENIQGRLTVKKSELGSQVIDDTYNANPLSVDAAIDVLANMESQKKILILGGMAELGENAKELHEKIGRSAKTAGIDCLYCVGRYAVDTADAFGENGFYFEDKKALINSLDKVLDGTELILVKGSRSAAMEEVVEWMLSPNNNNKRVN